MIFKEVGSIRFCEFEELTQAGIDNAVFMRKGGVSPVPWDSLNVGTRVGDDPARVIENHRRLFKAIGRPLESMFDSAQVHGSTTLTAKAPRGYVDERLEGDALLTDNPEVTLFMRFADCMPIFLFDATRRVVGLVHTGWRGTVGGTLSNALKTLLSYYGSRPKDILAAIGPGIGAHHYEVGKEVIEAVQRSFGVHADDLLPQEDGKVKFDMWAANKLLLEEGGVEQIVISGICTACQMGDWFSHRGEGGKTGRFGALIGLKQD